MEIMGSVSPTRIRVRADTSGTQRLALGAGRLVKLLQAGPGTGMADLSGEFEHARATSTSRREPGRTIRPSAHWFTVSTVVAGLSATVMENEAVTDGTRATKADVLAHALQQLGPIPERVLMVGDRAHDVEGAAAHGIATVVVGWGYGKSVLGV